MLIKDVRTYLKGINPNHYPYPIKKKSWQQIMEEIIKGKKK